MKLNIYAYAIIALAACNNPQTKQANSPIKQEEQKPLKNALNIVGIWADEEQPIFEIKKDSIYYIDSDKSFKYEVTDSVLTIFFDSYTYSGIIKQENEQTLLIKDSLNVNTYTREQE